MCWSCPAEKASGWGPHHTTASPPHFSTYRLLDNGVRPQWKAADRWPWRPTSRSCSLCVASLPSHIHAVAFVPTTACEGSMPFLLFAFQQSNNLTWNSSNASPSFNLSSCIDVFSSFLSAKKWWDENGQIVTEIGFSHWQITRWFPNEVKMTEEKQRKAEMWMENLPALSWCIGLAGMCRFFASRFSTTS